MNYTFCELYNKYTILSKYEQNAHFIQIASCLRAFPLLWNVQVRENEISLRNSSGSPGYLSPLEGTLLTMQCKSTFTKRFILSTLQKSPVSR